MLDSLKLGILAVSRKIRFRGKGRLLELMHLGVNNPHLVPESIDRVSCVEGITMYSSCPGDVMFRELFVHGYYQDDVLEALRYLLKPGEVFWDVGANYGFMSIFVDKVFSGAVRTVAFEPNPIVAKELRRNVELNRCKAVRIEESCLSDKVGDLSFYISDTHSWNATLLENFAALHDENVAVTVRSSTIDAYVLTSTPPSVIKIDVEGAEHLVIHGGHDFLTRARPPVIIEYNLESIGASGMTPAGYLQMFTDIGYTAFFLKRPLWGAYRWKTLTQVNSPQQLPELCNLILLKAEAAAMTSTTPAPAPDRAPDR